MHVLGSLTIGGIETWLVHVLRNRGNPPVRHEFLLTKEEVGPYEAEVRAMGIPINRIIYKRDPISWFRRARKFFEQRPDIAIVHSHGALHFTPMVLWAAKLAGIPGRIGHSHEARFRGADQQGLGARLKRALSVKGVGAAATRRIGISDAAAENIGGAAWRSDPKSSVLLYGFDYSKYDGAADRAVELRRQLRIASDTAVVGHVGRFDPVKNHELLVRAFAELAKAMPNSALVMVGIGETQQRTAELCEKLGIADRVRFPGTSDDIPAYMTMFDLFALPSFSEGLGIVVLEAQAAGTRSLVSTGVAREVGISRGGVEALPIADGPARWAAEMKRMIELPKPDRAEWRRMVEESPFGIRRCVADLNAIYASELQRAGIS